MKLYHKRKSRAGSAPGLLGAAEGARGGSRARLIHYGPDQLVERELDSIDEALAFVGRPGVTWIDLVAPDVATLERLGERLGLHPLALEDVVNGGQRPKLEEYEGNAFVVLKQIHADERGLGSEQLNIFFGAGFVVTVQDTPDDDWEPVRARLRSGRQRIRGAGSDYLAYALIDAVIDSAFPVLERYGDRIEDLQEELLAGIQEDTLERVHAINRELILIRRAAWPHREVVNALERSESGLVKKESRVFLRDCYDHTIQILDILESYRDLARGLMDLYLSMASNRMNEVMKVLTVMASIFIPLTFLAGIYGMNFNPEASPFNMPELNWRWGYPVFWLVMIGLAAGLLALFKRKRWL